MQRSMSMLLRYLCPCIALTISYSVAAILVPQTITLGPLLPSSLLLGCISLGYASDVRRTSHYKVHFLLYSLLTCIISIPIMAAIRSGLRPYQDFALNLGGYAALNIVVFPVSYVAKLAIDKFSR
jgi:hypothetical protein